MVVHRASSSGIMPFCVGSICVTMTNPSPLSADMWVKNSSKASSEPAEPPMPTMWEGFFEIEGRRTTRLSCLAAAYEVVGRFLYGESFRGTARHSSVDTVS